MNRDQADKKALRYAHWARRRYATVRTLSGGNSGLVAFTNRLSGVSRLAEPGDRLYEYVAGQWVKRPLPH